MIIGYITLAPNIDEADLTGTKNLSQNKEIMYIPLNPLFTL